MIASLNAWKSRAFLHQCLNPANSYTDTSQSTVPTRGAMNAQVNGS